jgi:hypothetical protein
MDHPMTAQDKKYQAESDMRTLIDAAKIQSDKPRREAALKMVREQRRLLSQLDGKEKTQEKV